MFSYSKIKYSRRGQLSQLSHHYFSLLYNYNSLNWTNYSWCHENGSFSVHTCNQHYLSTPQYTGSWGTDFRINTEYYNTMYICMYVYMFNRLIYTLLCPAVSRLLRIYSQLSRRFRDRESGRGGSRGEGGAGGCEIEPDERLRDLVTSRGRGCEICDKCCLCFAHFFNLDVLF